MVLLPLAELPRIRISQTNPGELHPMHEEKPVLAI
jgi:hypothetical protein